MRSKISSPCLVPHSCGVTGSAMLTGENPSVTFTREGKGLDLNVQWETDG